MEACFQSAYESYRDLIGYQAGPLSRRRGPGRPAKIQKIVVAGDFHCPFQSKAAVAQLVKEEASDTDLLILNGDIVTWWSASHWPKRRRVTNIQTEMAEAQATLCYLSRHFKQIRVLGGNHDARPKRLMAEQLPLEMIEYLDLVAPAAMDPLQFLIHGLDNVELVKAPVSDGAKFDFLYQVGDAVCTHAETYSKIPLKAAGNVSHWLKSFAEPKGLVHDVRVVIQAHTHQGGSVMGDFGCLLIEGGCLCEDEEYIGGARIQSPRPWALGWTVLYQQQGRTDQRISRFKPLAA